MKTTDAHLLALTLFLMCASAAVSEDNGFKTLPDTASPDGAFVFAYGPAGPAGKLDTFAEAAAGDTSVPRMFQPNYLVNARTHKIAAAIPMLNEMELNLDSPHSSFDVAWSSDGHVALAIFNGRYSSDTVMWVEPATKKFSEVTESLKTPVRKLVLERNGKKLAEMLTSIWLSDAVIGESGLLTLHASAADLGGGGSGLTFEYAMKFQMQKPARGKMLFKLLKSVVLIEGEIPANELEPELEKALGALHDALDKDHRERLQAEQTAWLKKRANIANDSERENATSQRIQELHARLVEW